MTFYHTMKYKLKVIKTHFLKPKHIYQTCNSYLQHNYHSFLAISCFASNVSNVTDLLIVLNSHINLDR